MHHPQRLNGTTSVVGLKNSHIRKNHTKMVNPRGIAREEEEEEDTSDLKVGTPVATLPGTWHCRVSAWTGWPDVSILRLGEIARLICNFCLSVAACTIV